MTGDLQNLQMHFRAAVLGDSDEGMTPYVAAPGNPPLVRRIAVYRNNVRGSLIDVLATAFPVVQRIVGAHFFAGIAEHFIIAAPPVAPHLSVYGAAFPAFIAAADIAQRLPYLPDIARLEWARGEAYFAASSPGLNPAELTEIAPEDMENLSLKFHPATRVLHSRFPIYRIWEVNQPRVTAVPQVDMSVAECVVITRPEHQVTMRTIGVADAALIGALENRLTLADAAAAACAFESAFDLQAALTQHLVHGTFKSLASL